MRKTPNKQAVPKRVAVIKNGHTDAEFGEMEERWVNHQGPYLTLTEVLTLEAEKAKNTMADPESHTVANS